MLKNASILIIDDDLDVLTAVRLLLKNEVKQIVTEKNPEQIRSHLSKATFDCILLDMNFNSTINTGNEGLFWLKEIKKLQPEAKVIMITAYADIDLAIRSLKEGARDFVVKPWQNDKLKAIIKETLKNNNAWQQDVTQSIANDYAGAEWIGESEVMNDLLYKISKIAATEANVLILGENGTGKDMLANIIHQKSTRANGPFVKVDLGALSENLFESELFGYKKGAFTDAREDRAGRFEAAHNGTLFLDEIGNVPLHLQSKLLTVLQNRMVNRLGSNETVAVNIRLICATNATLQDLANERRFRKDLMYRINTVELFVPPLRARGQDVMLLANHFCKMFQQKYFKTIEGIDRKATKKIMYYSFPGNVRELQSVMERAVIMADSSMVTEEDVLFSSFEAAQVMDDSADTTNLGMVEKNMILKVLEKHSGNLTKTAKELGLTRTALYRRLNKYDI
jgi:two-component system response regulator HydG